MKFRSGTLERSVKRWGRFRKPFKRINHGWKYVELEEQSIPINGTTAVDIIVVDSDDWVLAGTATSVKNVVVDVDVGITWSPTIDETPNTYNSWRIKMGLWCLNHDDTGGSVNTCFGEQRAIWWGTHSHNSGAVATANGMGDDRQWNRRMRARQRYIAFDDELRFKCQFDSDVGSAIADARLFLFGRVSWEVP